MIDTDICKPNEMSAHIAKGFKRGDTVICKIDREWTLKHAGKKVSKGDIGWVLGPGENEFCITCSFPNNVSGQYIIGTEVCRPSTRATPTSTLYARKVAPQSC